MDISRASNFERFVFDLVGRDPARVQALWAGLARDGSFDLSALKSEFESRYGFVSGASTHADRLATIRSVYDESGVLVDPHTADGVKVAREFVEPGVPMLVLKPPCRPSSPRPSRKRWAVRPRRRAIWRTWNRCRSASVMDCDAAAVRRYLEAHAKM